MTNSMPGVGTSAGPTAPMGGRRSPAQADRGGQGDADILRYLQERGSRPTVPVRLVIRRHRRAPHRVGVAGTRERRRERSGRRAWGIGALLGKAAPCCPTATLAPGVARPGGSWHHLADGLPRPKWRGVGDAGGGRHLFSVSPSARKAAFTRCRRRSPRSKKTGEGLPVALNPPGLRPGQRRRHERHGVVDWAGPGTAAAWRSPSCCTQRAPRNLPRVDVVLAGYRRHVTRRDAELGRWRLVVARPLVLTAGPSVRAGSRRPRRWRACPS